MSYPPELHAQEALHITTVIQDWAAAHGLTVRSTASPGDAASDMLTTPAPVTLFPSPIPRDFYEQALWVQKSYNVLYARISQDEEFLGKMVEEIMDVDDFVAQLWQVHLKVKNEGYTQSLSLGLFRSDYMLHQPSPSDTEHSIKQVEFNTIAAAFGGLAHLASDLHRYLNGNVYRHLENGPQEYAADQLPLNDPARHLATGITIAFDAYTARAANKSDQPGSHVPCIAFLVQPNERNIMDQRHIEYIISEAKPDVPIVRLTLAEVLDLTEIASTSNRELLYHPPHHPQQTYEVAVIYIRSGYAPTDYPSAREWAARLQLERSYAIKCPSILTQLAGAKKVQQLLATPSTLGEPSLLHRFLGTNGTTHDPNSPTGPEAINLLRPHPQTSPSTDSSITPQTITTSLEHTFTTIHPLDDSPAGLAAQRIALDPVRSAGYVLKPQREGGGNNVYRGVIPAFLRERVPRARWKSYILMEMITPPPEARNTILRAGRLETGGVICELGVFGACLWDGARRKTTTTTMTTKEGEHDGADAGDDDGDADAPRLGRSTISAVTHDYARDGPRDVDDILWNQEAGYLLRTKGNQAEEGGVAAGFGSMDSCLLV